MSVDITVCVTARDETIVAGPTMKSAELACAFAEADGFTVERVIALDDPTDECREFFTEGRFSGWRIDELAESDLGHARNELARRAAGRWIAFLDADDLFSENWLATGARVLDAAEQAGERVIVHPELNWLFDGASAIFVKLPQDDPNFTPSFFYFGNYYDSLCLTPREAHLEIPYVPRDIPNGLSYQDWQFSIETMAAGWRHVIARDTIIFKRRRDASLVTESQARRAVVRAVDPLAVHRISELGRGEWSFDPEAVPRPEVEIRHDMAAYLAPPETPEELAARPRPVPWLVEPAGAPRRPWARRASVQILRWLLAGRFGLVRDYLALRRSAAFDEAFYLDVYRDVRKSKLDGLAHYVLHGAQERRIPSPEFNVEAYLEEHPEVRISGVNPLLHQLAQGRKTNGSVPARERTGVESL